MIFLKFKLNFIFEFSKKIGHTTRGNGKFWKILILKFEKNWPYQLKYATKIWNEKIWKFSFLNFDMKKLKIFIFEIWNENFRLKFEKK
jgi:hypothetical protein